MYTYVLLLPNTKRKAETGPANENESANKKGNYLAHNKEPEPLN